MEALECQNGQKGQSIDFYRFVKNVQHNVERTLLSKRNRHQRRKQMKQNWLVRSKIIPPSFKKIGKESPQSVDSVQSILHLASFYDYPKATSVNGTDADIRSVPRTSYHPKPKLERPQCKTSHAILRSVASCDRVRSNWKLQFRRDELNVLKYRRQEDDFSETEILTSPAAMRIRKVPRKFQELKIQTHQLYRTNLSSSIKERTSPPNIRCRTLNCSRQ